MLGGIVVDKVQAADEFETKIPLSCELLVNVGLIVNPYQQHNMPYQVDSSLGYSIERSYWLGIDNIHADLAITCRPFDFFSKVLTAQNYSTLH